MRRSERRTTRSDANSAQDDDEGELGKRGQQHARTPAQGRNSSPDDDAAAQIPSNEDAEAGAEGSDEDEALLAASAASSPRDEGGAVSAAGRINGTRPVRRGRLAQDLHVANFQAQYDVMLHMRGLQSLSGIMMGWDRKDVVVPEPVAAIITSWLASPDAQGASNEVSAFLEHISYQTKDVKGGADMQKFVSDKLLFGAKRGDALPEPASAFLRRQHRAYSLMFSRAMHGKRILESMYGNDVFAGVLLARSDTVRAELGDVWGRGHTLDEDEVISCPLESVPCAHDSLCTRVRYGLPDFCAHLSEPTCADYCVPTQRLISCLSDTLPRWL